MFDVDEYLERCFSFDIKEEISYVYESGCENGEAISHIRDILTPITEVKE